MKFVLALILSVVTFSFAQYIPYEMSTDYKFREKSSMPEHRFCNHSKNHNTFQSSLENSAIEHRNYDVLRYDLDLDLVDLFNDTNATHQTKVSFSGINKMTFKPLEEGLNSIELDAAGLLIDSVEMNGKTLNYDQDINDHLLNVHFENALNLDKKYEIVIHYTYNNIPDKGFYYYNAENSDALHNIAYTQSEPVFARYWIPSNDRPYEKQLASMSLKVPNNLTATSNGDLDSLVYSNDSTNRTFHYSIDYPLTTYLMVFNVSEYEYISDSYQRHSDPQDSVPLHYFVWNEDLKHIDGKEQQSKYAGVPEMLDIMSEAFGKYPYDTYGMTAVLPYGFGGMEHTTMSTVHRNWVTRGASQGILHEIAHQWIGDLITCATWKDLWINEGGASWSEAYYLLEKFKRRGDTTKARNYYLSVLNSQRYGYMRSSSPSLPIYDVPLNQLFSGYYTLSYYKGSWIYHMLGELLGHDEFLRLLRGLMDEYKFESVESKDFANYFIENAQFDEDHQEVDLEKYFMNWLFKAGHPRYNLKLTRSDDSTANIFADQLQAESDEDAFVTPLGLYVMYSDSTTEFKEYRMQQKENNFEFSLSKDSLEIIDFDTYQFSGLHETVSKEIIKTSVEGQNDVVSKAYPNPVKSGDYIYLELGDKISGTPSINVFDIYGNKININKYNVLSGNTLHLKTNELNSGVYYIKIFNGNKSWNFKISVVN